MKFLKRLVGRFYITKKRKNKLEEFIALLKHVKNVAKPEECREAYAKVIAFVNTLDRDDALRHMCGDIIDYLSDTIYHAERGYHKPRHNGWNTVRVYPNINDYIKLGAKI